MAGLMPSANTCCDPCADRVTTSVSLNDLISDQLTLFSGVTYLKSYGAAQNGVIDDSAAWVAALAAIPPSGGVLVVTGPSAVGSTGILLDTRDNITIIGEGPDAGIVALATTVIDIPVTATVGTVLAMRNCTRCRISGLIFNGSGLRNKGVGMEGCTDCTVSGNEFHAFDCAVSDAMAAVMSWGGSRNSFLDNYIHDTTGDSKGFWVGNIQIGEPEDTPVVQGNIVNNVGHDGFIGTYVGATIVNNIFDTCGGSGIGVAGVNDPGDCKRSTIGFNVCRRCTYHGIQSDSLSFSTKFITVIGNICEENTITGIYAVNTRDWIIQGNVVRNNNFTDTGGILVAGIYIDDAARLTVTGNICRDDRGASRKQDVGIAIISQVGAVSDVIIANNLLDGNAFDGLLVQSSTPNTVTTINISGNVATNNTHYGIQIADALPGEVTGCTVIGNSYAGNGTGPFTNEPTDTFVVGAGLPWTGDIGTTGINTNYLGAINYFTGQISDSLGAWALSPAGILTVGIGRFTAVGEFTDNADAILNGLTAGYIYRTGDFLKIVH